MTFRVALPTESSDRSLDIVDGSSSAVQRKLRRVGIAGFEPSTMAALLAAFESCGEDLVFYDVGANIGLYAAVCSAMFDPVAVVAFEPTPGTAQIARSIFDRNGVEVDLVEAAVGEAAGRDILFLSATSDASNSMVAGFKQEVGTVEVEVVAIDEIVAAGRPAPTVIKIDVETFEPAVLRGAQRTIAEHRPIIVLEVLHRRGFDHGPDIEAEMAGLGYSFYWLSAHPAWKRRRHIRGKRGADDRDWLLTPEPIDDAFIDRFDRQRLRVAACTADRNGRLPVIPSIRLVAGQRGWGTIPFLARLALDRAVAAVGDLRESLRRRITPNR